EGEGLGIEPGAAWPEHAEEALRGAVTFWESAIAQQHGIHLRHELVRARRGQGLRRIVYAARGAGDEPNEKRPADESKRRHICHRSAFWTRGSSRQLRNTRDKRAWLAHDS